MTLSLEDFLIIQDTVNESYQLHRNRIGDERAREVTNDLYEELINRHRIDTYERAVRTNWESGHIPEE